MAANKDDRPIPKYEMRTPEDPPAKLCPHCLKFCEIEAKKCGHCAHTFYAEKKL